jgi:hypothetical protein
MTQMKHIIATALLAAATLMVQNGASAQAKEQATIPFDFTVGQNQLPAGTYTIKNIQPGVIELDGHAKHAHIMTLCTSTEDVKQNADKLVFSKYGDQYFLREVRGSYGQTAWKMAPSKLEKRVQLEEARLARNQQTSEVAMK